MAVAQGPSLAAVLLLVSGLHCSALRPPCPESCSCHKAPLLNCSSSGLSLVPQHIQDSVTELDLSHNLLDTVTLDRPHFNLRSVLLGNNSITHLSLCIERDPGSRYVRGRPLHRFRLSRRRGCVSWAPTLQLLSVERNQLEQLPQGLEGSESLQVLQLSFNKISTLRPGELSHLRQLKELHLRHNLITSLHPQMFQDLAQLRVLDLSFNVLTSLHPLIYLSLRNIGADVRLDGNRWQCDCSMRSLRRWLAYDSSRGSESWSMVCASPSSLSGRDMLQLEEDDLNCFGTERGPELHQEVTVYSGSEILLSCSTQDSVWWMPSGQASVSQPQADLLISDITERDTGLYVCVSKEHNILSVFSLQISKIGGEKRKTRSLSRARRQIVPQATPNRKGQERNQRALQPDLTLAVCLSVFITFLVAFILGVLARPCIDVLWRRVTKKKRSSATNSVSSVEQNNYENEAYYNDEEPEDVGTHRERRVTFSNVEDINVQYYDTIPNLESNNNDAVIECEAAEAEKDTECLETNQRDSREGIEAGRTHKIEFEHIPDPVELDRGRSSSCSDSSLSDETFNQDKKNRGDDLTPKSRQPAEDSVQQRADASTAGKVEGPREPPGFSSEPFADWSPHADNANLTYCDLGQENEEQFEFSDSIQSTSTPSGSACGSFNDSKLIVAPSTDKQKTDDMSSSSSYVSEDEVTQYIVNSDQEEEDIERNHNKPEITTCLKQDASFEQQIRPSVQYNQGDYRYDKHRPTVRHDDSFSSRSSDSDEENYTVKKGSVTSQGKSLDTQAPSLPAAYSSSSSSESEAEITDLKGKQSKDRVIKSIKITEPETLSTDLDGLCIPQMNKRVAINAPLPVSDSSSNDETMDLTTKHSNKQEQREVDMAGLPVKEFQSVSHDAIKPQLPSPIKRRAPLPPTNSSSSGERTKETMDQMQKQGETHMTMLPVGVSQKIGLDHPQPPWPALDLEHTTRIKRRLDIKAPSPASASSSSSDSEDETTHQTKRPGKVEITGLPLQESQTGSHDPDTRWPALDLEHFPRINRRLDIKAPPPDLSCKSGSEDETTIHIKNQEQGPMNMARLPSKVSQTGTYKNPQPQWPALELEHTTRIKRRLDIKAPSLASDSSSSSDSDDETIHHTERPRRVDIAGSKVSQTVSYDPQTQFPALDLDHTMRIKRRLDIKAPSPASDSSSSSDSEDETHPTTKERPGLVGSAGHQFQESQVVNQDPETQWPALDLGNITRIKRRLDIKGPSPPPDSILIGGMSNTVEGKTVEAVKEEGMENLRYPPTTVKPDSRWPRLDLSSALYGKRHLNIKIRSPPPESSSSSNKSEDGTTDLPVKVETDRTGVGITSYQPWRNLPDMSVTVPPVKRRLYIKGSSQPTDSCSPSIGDNESRITNNEQQAKLQKFPYIHRRLEIKAPSPQSDPSLSSVSPDFQKSESNSSRSNSEDEYRDQPKLGLGVSSISKPTEKEFISLPKTHISHSPKTDHNITLEKYTIVKEEVGGETKMDISKTPEITPELQSRWATMNLGVSRFRKRLEITSHTHKPPHLPSSTPPDSPSSSSSESGTGSKSSRIRRKRRGVGIQEIMHTESSQSLTNIPPIYMDIRAPLQRDSSSSNSEDETIEHSVPDLSLGVPRVKRRLDVKAPLPEQSDSPSSCSESEIKVTRYTENQSRRASNMSGMTDDDSLITYKRIIMKASSPPDNSFYPSDKGQTIDPTKQRHMGSEMLTVERERKRVPSLNFDKVVKKRIEQPRHTTGVDLPPEIRWTGVGRQLSDLSFPSPRRDLDTGLSSPQHASSAEPELPQPDSSSIESDHTKQDRGGADVTLMDKHSSPSSSSVSLAPSRAEERMERKGLSALKAMSSLRSKWEPLDQNLDKGASPVFDYQDPQSVTSFNYRRSEDIKPLAKQPLTQSHRSSTSVAERRATDLLYDIPRYRRHDIGGIEPPQRAPPPIPATPPPPYDAVGLTWRSPQSNRTQVLEGTRSYLQQSRNTEGYDPSSLAQQNQGAYFDSSNVNISEV